MIADIIKLKYKIIYAIIYGREHFPPHAIFSFNKRDGKPGIKVDLDKIIIMKRLNGGLDSKIEKQILSYLRKNPKFVQKLKNYFKQLNPHLYAH